MDKVDEKDPFVPEENENAGKPLSRRQMIGSLGSGLAAVAIAPAFGEETALQGQGRTYSSTAQPKQDPATKYPKPPYSPRPRLSATA
jgi:hypothetical protein